jgi:hypothetical protein
LTIIEEPSNPQPIPAPADPTPAPAPSTPPSIADHYAVQAGAFSDRSRADALRDLLAEQLTASDDPRVVGPAGNPPLWHVITGHNLNEAAAAALMEKVRKVVGVALVVPDPEFP